MPPGASCGALPGAGHAVEEAGAVAGGAEDQAGHRKGQRSGDRATPRDCGDRYGMDKDRRLQQRRGAGAEREGDHRSYAQRVAIGSPLEC